MKLYEFVDKLYAMGDMESPKTVRSKKTLNESLMLEASSGEMLNRFFELNAGVDPEELLQWILQNVVTNEQLREMVDYAEEIEHMHAQDDIEESLIEDVDESGITQDKINKTLQVLIDNGIDEDEAEIVLQAIGYTLLDKELFPEDDLDEDLNEALFSDNELGEYIRKHLNPELSLADVEVYNSGNHAEVQVQLEPEIYNNDGYGYTFNFVPKETSVEDFFDYVVNSLNNVSLEEGMNEKPLTEAFVRQWFPSDEDYFYNDLSGIVEIKKVDTRYDDMTDEEQTLYEFSGTKDAFQYIVDNFGYFEDLEYQKKYQDDELEYSDDIANLQYSDD